MNREELVRCREDLLEPSRSGLLGVLGSLVTVSQFGDRPIVIAAPHDGPGGQALSTGMDCNTGRLADLLARELGCRLVVATELRTFVDINKDPWELEDLETGRNPGNRSRKLADRALKLFYQSQIFSNRPRIVVEIHGFKKTRKLDVEASSGIEPRPGVSHQLSLEQALGPFRKALAEGIAQFDVGGSRATAGVYPLDNGVILKATGTHTFQKIAGLRRFGENVAGVHIEIGGELRPNPAANEDHYAKLATALASAVEALDRGLASSASFEPDSTLLGDFDETFAVFERLSEAPLTVKKAPRELVGKGVVVLSAADCAAFGLAEGEELVVSNRKTGDPFVIAAIGAPEGRAGGILIDMSLRAKLGVKVDDQVYVGRMRRSSQPGSGDTVLALVERIDEGGEPRPVAVGRELEADISALGTNAKLEIRNCRKEALPLEVRAGADETLGPRGLAIPVSLARALELTHGEVVLIRRAGQDDEDPKFKWRAQRTPKEYQIPDDSL